MSDRGFCKMLQTDSSRFFKVNVMALFIFSSWFCFIFVLFFFRFYETKFGSWLFTIAAKSVKKGILEV